MKTAQDPRHRARIKTMQDLFAWNFLQESQEEAAKSADLSVSETAEHVIEHLEPIDQAIQEAAPTWPIEKINKIDLAILRLAVYELIINTENPSKVIVDEAVELAKEYGAESSASFINGALGKLIVDHKINA